VAVGFSGLGLGTIIREGDGEFEQRVVAFQALEIHVGKSDGGNFFRSYEFSQPARRKESYVIEILGNIAFPRSGRSGDAQRALLPLVFMPGKMGSKTSAGGTLLAMCSLKISS